MSDEKPAAMEALNRLEATREEMFSAKVMGLDDGLAVVLVPDEYPCAELRIRPTFLRVDGRRWEHTAQDPEHEYADETLFEGEEIRLNRAIVSGATHVESSMGADGIRLAVETAMK